MLVLPQGIIEKYNIIPMDEFVSKDNEPGFTYSDWCVYFLNKTDHIPNKIIEAQALGNTPEDYTEILTYRQTARDEINRVANV